MVFGQFIAKNLSYNFFRFFNCAENYLYTDNDNVKQDIQLKLFYLSCEHYFTNMSVWWGTFSGFLKRIIVTLPMKCTNPEFTKQIDRILVWSQIPVKC